MKRLILSGAMAALLLTQTGCLGTFAVTKNLLEFNNSVTNDKIVNNLIFWAMNIVPVYSIAVLVDAVVLNLIEFWTGTNPIAMNEGDIQEQFITHNGVDYKVTATKNQFQFEKVVGNELVDLGAVAFTSDDMVWNYEYNGEVNPIVQINDDNSVTYFTENGTATVFNNDMETLVYERSMADGLIEMAKR
tara:strand:- start:3299 stop:3865 length:567 start_codon:yes stop_codon:yes gene_type:complete